MSQQDWPFDQPPNCGVITIRQVVSGEEPILDVYHDLDDHGWQFIGASGANTDDGMIVSLQAIVELDPTVLEVADMEPGWVARRDSADAPWVRERFEE